VSGTCHCFSSLHPRKGKQCVDIMPTHYFHFLGNCRRCRHHELHKFACLSGVFIMLLSR